MTKVLCEKRLGSLAPLDQEAHRVFQKIKNGTKVLVDVKDMSRRSNRQHRYWFAMLGILFENQEYFTDVETFRRCLLIKLGFCDWYKFKNGQDIPVPHSLQFHKMSPDEFGRLVDATLGFAAEVGIDPDALVEETKARAE
jgi:hypothetical protein